MKLKFTFIAILAMLFGFTFTVNAQQAVEVATLDELQTALSGENETVLITEQIEIPQGETIVLDLNGKTVNSVFNGTSTTNHIYALSNKGTLTIQGNGSINSRGIYNYGSLTLNAGAINAIDGNGGYAVNNQNGSTFVMNGGVVAATNEDDNMSSSGGYDATALKVPAGCTATLNGGTINNVCDFTFAIDAAGTLNIPATSTIIVNGTHGAIAVSGGTTTIDAGTFQIPADEYSRTDNVLYVSGGSLVVNGGTFIGDSDTAAGGSCLCDEAGKAVVNGGTFKGSSGGDVWGTTGGTTIKGGTFENLIETQHVAVGATIVNGGKSYVKNENGEMEEAPAYVAKIGEQGYATLAEAVAAAQNNETITLIDNVVLAEVVTIPAGKTLTIDLNGKAISMEESIITTAYAINNLGNLTIKDGVGGGSINARGIYNGYGDSAANVATAKITVLSGTINAKGTNGGGAAIFNYGVADIQGGTFTSVASYAIALQTASTMTIGENAIITGGINSWQSTLTITGGTISNDKSGKHVVYAGESAVTINGGTFHNNNSGNATIMASGSTAAVEITGGTFTLNIVNAASSYLIDATSSATYTISGGSFTGGIRAQGGTKYEITGGTFTNEYGNYNVYEGGDINISGGTFTGNYAQEFATDNLAAGYELGADGKVTSSIAYVAKIGEQGYATLAEAVAAAQNNETIVLLADAEVVADETITLNGVNLSTLNGVTLTNNGTVEVKGEVSLNIETLTGEEINFLDGAIVKNSTIGGSVFVAGNVTFRGANTFAMLYDYGTLTDYYGTTAPMKWTVEEGASVTLTNAARYGLGYGDDVTVYGNIENALTARENLTDADRSLFMHGLVAQESKGWNCDSKFTVENAYVAIGSNNSFGNKSGNYGGTYTFNIKNSVVDASRITFYEALSTTTFTFDGCDVKMGTFMTRDADSKFTLKNSKVLSTTASNGTDEGNYNKGELTLENSTLTYSAEFKHEAGTINLDLNSSITAPKMSGVGTININAEGVAAEVLVVKANMSGFTGAINVEGGKYEITDEGLVVKPMALTGAGTEANPYLINNVDDLVLFRNSVNAGETKYNAEGVYVALGANIDLTGIDWSVNIGDDFNATFDGIFDGKGYTISNLTATETATKADGYICTGLFGAIYGKAVVKNFTLENVTINAPFVGNNVSAVVGFAYACKGSIENVKVVGVNINAPKATAVGAIVGYDYYSPALTVKNCVVKGNDGSAIVGKSYTGGLVGYASSKIAMNNNTIENISITATASVGAVAGIMLGGSSATDNTVKNVSVVANGALWANSAAVVAGTISGGSVTVSNTTVENVTANGAEARLVGGILVEKPTTAIAKVQAQIGDKFYATLQAAVTAAKENETITLIADVEVAADEEITLNGLDVDAENVTLTINGTVNVDLNSTLSITTVVGNGTINVDATGVMEEVVVVAGDMSGFAGAINVTGGDCEIRNEGLVAYNASYISNYVFDDANSVDYTFTGEKTVGTLTYKRTLIEGIWNALYLPFEIDVKELVENYDIAYYNQMHSYDSDNNGSFDSYEMEVAYITSGTLRANYPYFIRPKNAEDCELEYVANDVTLSPAVEKKIQTSSVANIFTLSGTHKAMNASELAGCYAISVDGDWSATAGLKAHRLYLKIEENDNSPFATTRAKSIRIVVAGETDGTTGIEGVEYESTEAIYDLSGRRVQETVKGGIYIVNGKKVLVK